MNITVYCGSSTGNDKIFVEGATALGTWIGKNGHTLVYGGSNTGLMGAVADATLKAGGKVIGVVPNVSEIQGRKHTGVTQLIETESMSDRRNKMIELGDVFVALPGGLGTLDEITEIMSLSSLNLIKSPVIFFNTKGYYDQIKVVFCNILNAGFGKLEYFDAALFSDDFEEIEKFIKEFK